MITRSTLAAAAMLSLTLLTGCGGGAAGPSADPAPSTTPTPTPDGCLSVPRSLLRAIASGAEDGVSFKITRGAAVRSPDFKRVFFVAGQLAGAGGLDDAVVWVSNSLQPGGGTFMAVDGFAQQFTVWPDADTTDAQISGADPSVDAAKACLDAVTP